MQQLYSLQDFERTEKTNSPKWWCIWISIQNLVWFKKITRPNMGRRQDDLIQTSTFLGNEYPHLNYLTFSNLGNRFKSSLHPNPNKKTKGKFRFVFWFLVPLSFKYFWYGNQERRLIKIYFFKNFSLQWFQQDRLNNLMFFLQHFCCQCSSKWQDLQL